MSTSDRKLPIGIQDFEGLIRDGYVYVDKTGFIFDLISKGKVYFLSRPRRFGKSLLLSTMKAYFEGKRDLFNGLAIEKLLEDDAEAWSEYPVFYFDFNSTNYRRNGALEEVLSRHLEKWEALYGEEKQHKSIDERFEYMIEEAHVRTGKRVVVLVDEYDKPLLETEGQEELQEHNRAVFKGFFSNLKSQDAHLKFVFITGVTRFTKVSIFSDLNHLKDISTYREYSGVCGITQKELDENFQREIRHFAETTGESALQVSEQLKKHYDGYHFADISEDIYNPFSLLGALDEGKYESYWFSTGTPTFLIDKIKKAKIDIRRFSDNDIDASADELRDYRDDNPNPVPLLYQTGYLTIKGYDRQFKSYELGYPNEEVRYGFLNSLAPAYISDHSDTKALDIRRFGQDILKGNTDGLKERFTALFASLPYPNDDKAVEYNFQIAIYLIFTLLGQFVHTEVHSSRGRADCVVETDRYVYIFEFKMDKSAKEALQQIEDKGYALPYAADDRQIIKIGVSFDSTTSGLAGWDCR